jgi:hypothetical protein
MPLEVTPVHRNLHQRVTFFYLEFEDLFIVIGLAAVMNVVGRFMGRNLYGVPLNLILQYGVPVVAVPLLMLFKYGKPRGYIRDLLVWYAKPHIYCGLEPDREFTKEYLK